MEFMQKYLINLLVQLTIASYSDYLDVQNTVTRLHIENEHLRRYYPYKRNNDEYIPTNPLKRMLD